jgi:hypothetical protein
MGMTIPRGMGFSSRFYPASLHGVVNDEAGDEVEAAA